jgi:tRNA-2-methylthio-N6-dimethylallyladenosine synthase
MTEVISEQVIPRKVLIETWGCQMNVADSENMLAMLQQDNYVLTDNEDDADLVLLNTCHIREKARHKVVSRLGRLKEIKDRKPNMKIAVAGCVAQAEGRKLLQEAPQIDVLLGPGKIPELRTLLRENEISQTVTLAVGFDKKDRSYPRTDVDTEAKPAVSGKNEISRYVNITQGCNNFCTFCVVPHTRGREISRHPDQILAECRNLVRGGAYEITLLGQNVNSFGSDLIESSVLPATSSGPFVDLLDQVARLDGLHRLRFTTSNPHDFTRPLADIFFKYPQMGRYIHLPVQSGNDEVLERMKRKVTVAEYHERVNWLRSQDPDFAISTDLIVGFPGETEEQFEDTVKLVEEVKFSFIFSFMYSPRKSTPAARFKDQIPEVEKSRRLQRLNTVQNAITLAANEAEIGKERQVLFLYESKKHLGSYYGRTEQFRLVKVEANRSLVGQTLPIRITEANKTALVGKLI